MTNWTPPPPPGRREDPYQGLNEAILDLKLSVRSRKCLTRLHSSPLEQLVQKSSEELLGTHNFGVISLNEIREKLKKLHGLSLKGESGSSLETTCKKS